MEPFERPGGRNRQAAPSEAMEPFERSRLINDD
jgi:hypothetical protein